MKPIEYPVQIVTGGGRARGFKVAKYLSWSDLPRLEGTDVWQSLLFLYDRLATGYDHYYDILGFMSPKMKALLQTLQGSYANSYRTNPYENYHKAFGTDFRDIAEAYAETDYSRAYTNTLISTPLGGMQIG